MPINLDNESDFIKNCARGNTQGVREALATDKSIANIPAATGMTPVMLAARFGKAANLAVLLENGADPDIVITTGHLTGFAAISFAAMFKHETCVSLLLRAGIKNLDTKPASGPNAGITPLLMAANKSEWKIVKELLLAGARDLECAPRDLDKFTVLWMATLAGVDEVVKLLLLKGASLDIAPLMFLPPSAENFKKMKAYHRIAAARRLFEIAEGKVNIEELEVVLGSLNGALNGRMQGKTAVQVALERENTRVFETLVECRADIFLADTSSPFSLSVAQLSKAPMVQGFAKIKLCGDILRDFKTRFSKEPVKEGKEGKEGKEAKEGKEDKEFLDQRERAVAELRKHCREILKHCSELKNELRNQICYELGALLETALPLFRSELIMVLKQVTAHSADLYRKANGILYDHGIVLSKNSKKLIPAAKDGDGDRDRDKDRDGYRQKGREIDRDKDKDGDRIGDSQEKPEATKAGSLVKPLDADSQSQKAEGSSGLKFTPDEDTEMVVECAVRAGDQIPSGVLARALPEFMFGKGAGFEKQFCMAKGEGNSEVMLRVLKEAKKRMSGVMHSGDHLAPLAPHTLEGPGQDRTLEQKTKVEQGGLEDVPAEVRRQQAEAAAREVQEVLRITRTTSDPTALLRFSGKESGEHKRKRESLGATSNIAEPNAKFVKLLPNKQ
jgi:ankyrin repeat protein